MFTQGGLKIQGQFMMKKMWKWLQIVKEMNEKDEENFKMYCSMDLSSCYLKSVNTVFDILRLFCDRICLSSP